MKNSPRTLGLGVAFFCAALATALSLRSCSTPAQKASESPDFSSKPPPKTNLAPGYHVELGELPVFVKQTHISTTGIQIDFESDAPMDTVSFRDPEPKPENLKSRLEDKTLYFSGDFIPGKTYRVFIYKDSKNKKGATLPEDMTFDLEVPDLAPKSEFLSSGIYLPLSASAFTLPYSVLNRDEISVSVYRAFENNIHPFYHHDYYDRLLLSTNVAVRTKKNVAEIQSLDLGALLGEKTPGVYRVTMDNPDSWYDEERYVSLTDIAQQVVHDSENGKILVFLRSFSSHTPITNATITVLSRKNQCVASGISDEQGICTLSYDPEWDRENDSVTGVFARAGKDFSYFRIVDGKQSYPQRGTPFQKNQFRAFVFTERGVARPGETFTAFSFLRQEKDGAFIPAKNTALVLKLRDPSGDVLTEKELSTDEYGFLQVDFSVPEDAKTGFYTVSCLAVQDQQNCGSEIIQIASYVPDRIKVSGKCTTENPSPDSAVHFEFNARYYFDEPVTGGSYRYEAFLQPGANPEHWDGWAAGVDPDFKENTLTRKSGTLSGVPLAFSIPAIRAEMKNPILSPVELYTSFTASEPGGRGVTATQSIPLYFTDFFLGLREGDSQNACKTIAFTLLSPQADAPIILPEEQEVTFELIRKEWEYALVRKDNGWKREWRQNRISLPEQAKNISIPAGEFRVDSLSPLSWNLPSGSYELIARCGKTHESRLSFWHREGDSDRRSENPYSLVFTPNTASVPPGETFSFDVEALSDGEAFLTYGEHEIDGYQVLPVKAGKNTFSLPVPEGVQGSAYHVGCTIVSLEKGVFTRSFGMFSMKVDQTKRHRLSVAIKHPEQAEPGETVSVLLSLSDPSGAPVSGKVALYAVDAGVLSLTDYRTPDIFARFYGPSACPLSFYDVYSMVYEDLTILPDETIGGDRARRKLGSIKQEHSVRLIAPAVSVPESGNVEVPLTLPQHTGALKFFAVASGETAVGSTSSSMTLRKKISLTLNAPRFLAAGDEAELSVTLFNHAEEDGESAFELALPEVLEILASPDGHAVKNLPKGGQKTLRFTLRAKEATGSFDVGAKFWLGKSVVSAKQAITLRPVLSEQSFQKVSLLKPGETLKLVLSNDFCSVPESQILVCASPAFAVRKGLEWLQAYPYGCLEQTTACAFPFLSLQSLVASGLLEKSEALAHAGKPAMAYAHLLSMKLPSGAFSMWSGASKPWHEASLFALHFIFEAHRKNAFRVSPENLALYRKYLTNTAYDATPQMRTQSAYAAYLLALSGDRAFLKAARNIVAGTKQPDFALFLAGAALVKGDYAYLGTKPMLDAVKAKCYLQHGVPTSFSDNTCRLGMVLYMLMDCGISAPDTAAALAFALSRTMNPNGTGWSTTHANAWASLGLSAYAEKFPPEAGKVLVTMADKAGETFLFNAEKCITPKDSLAPVSIQNLSSNALLVAHSGSGIPRNPAAVSGPISVKKEYLNEKGEAATSFSHGERVFVRITLNVPETIGHIKNLVLCDLLPAGLEIEDEMLATRAANIPADIQSRYGSLHPERLEKRDDRFLLFGDIRSGESQFTYQTRAVIRGSFTLPPTQVEAMYDPTFCGIYSSTETFFVQ